MTWAVEWISEQITSAHFRGSYTDSHHGGLSVWGYVQKLWGSHHLPSCLGRTPSERKLFSRGFVAGDVSAIIPLREQRNHSSVNPSPRCRYTCCPPLSVSRALSLFFSLPLLLCFSLEHAPPPIEGGIVMDRACSHCASREPRRPQGPLAMRRSYSTTHRISTSVKLICVTCSTHLQSMQAQTSASVATLCVGTPVK